MPLLPLPFELYRLHKNNHVKECIGPEAFSFAKRWYAVPGATGLFVERTERQGTAGHSRFRMGRLRGFALCRQEAMGYAHLLSSHSFIRRLTVRTDVTMISASSYFNFTPLLASCAVGTLEFRSAIEPVRPVKMEIL